MTLWRITLGIVALLITGCGSVTSVHGWAGGPVAAGVQDGTAVVRYKAPSAGWRLTVDRTKVDAGTAKMWITAHAGPSGPRTQTQIEASWTPEEAQIGCTQAYIRVERKGQPAGAYIPAAVGCGPLAP